MSKFAISTVFYQMLYLNIVLAQTQVILEHPTLKALVGLLNTKPEDDDFSNDLKLDIGYFQSVKIVIKLSPCKHCRHKTWCLEFIKDAHAQVNKAFRILQKIKNLIYPEPYSSFPVSKYSCLWISHRKLNLSL